MDGGPGPTTESPPQFTNWEEATEDEILKALLKAMNPCSASQKLRSCADC